MTFPRFKLEQSKQEFYTSTSGLALVGVALNRFTTLVSRTDKAAPKRGIAASDALRSYLGLLCQGKVILLRSVRFLRMANSSVVLWV